MKPTELLRTIAKIPTIGLRTAHVSQLREEWECKWCKAQSIDSVLTSIVHSSDCPISRLSTEYTDGH